MQAHFVLLGRFFAENAEQIDGSRVCCRREFDRIPRAGGFSGFLYIHVVSKRATHRFDNQKRPRSTKMRLNFPRRFIKKNLTVDTKKYK